MRPSRFPFPSVQLPKAASSGYAILSTKKSCLMNWWL